MSLRKTNAVVPRCEIVAGANARKLRQAACADAALAIVIEEAKLLPWSVILSIPLDTSRRFTRSMDAQGATALGKEIAQNEQRSRELARLRDREDLLPALDRARQMLRAFAGAPAPEFQGSLRHKPRY